MSIYKIYTLKIFAITCLLAMAAVSLTAQNRSGNGKKSQWLGNHGSFDFGYAQTRLSGFDMKDFDLSDNKVYGLKGVDSNSMESRFRVPLSEYLKEAPVAKGFYVGFRWNYLQKMQGGVHFRSVRNKWASSMQFSMLLSPQIYTLGRFRLVSDIELGISSNRIYTGPLSPLPGYHQHLRADYGFDLREGSGIRISNSDYYASAGLNLQFALTRHIRLFQSATYNLLRNVRKGHMNVHSGNGSGWVYYNGELYAPLSEGSPVSEPPSNVNIVRQHVMLQFGLMLDLQGYYEKKAKTCSCCGR